MGGSVPALMITVVVDEFCSGLLSVTVNSAVCTPLLSYTWVGDISVLSSLPSPKSQLKLRSSPSGS